MWFRLFAVVLILLAVSPFTAPFATCDLMGAGVLHPDSAGFSTAKTSPETTVIPFHPTRLVADFCAVMLQRSTFILTIDAQLICPLVLRV